MQFTSYLNRKFFIWPLIKLIEALGAKLLYILKVIKPLYRIPEVGNNLFVTYHGYQMKKLGMEPSINDSYLLYNLASLGIVGP